MRRARPRRFVRFVSHRGETDAVFFVFVFFWKRKAIDYRLYRSIFFVNWLIFLCDLGAKLVKIGQNKDHCMCFD